MTHPEAAILPKFIAVVGQEGCGKDVYGHHLEEEYGYMHVSAGDVIRERARAEGITVELTREILGGVGDRFKQQFGPSPIVESSVREHEKNVEIYPAGLVITGLRRAAELEVFKAKYGAVVLWIDTTTERRFENQRRRGRGGDQQDFESFKKRSEIEYFGNTEGGAVGVNLRAVEALADCRVKNDRTLEELFVRADEELAAMASSK